MLQIALAVALRITWGLTEFSGQVSVEDDSHPPVSLCYEAHARSPSCSCFCSSLLLCPPPPLGYFLAIRIHLLSLPVISVPTRSLRHFVYFVLLLFTAFSEILGLSLSLSLVSVSQFLILRFSQTRSQQPHWGETILL